MTSPSKELLLYDLYKERDKGIKILGLENPEGEDVTVIFGHIDGMYSYCWVENEPGEVVHLSAVTPLEKIDEGTYKVIEG